MDREKYLAELEQIKADIESEAPALGTIDGAIAFAHRQRKLGMVQEMIDRANPVYEGLVLIDPPAMYDGDGKIMDLLRRINAVGL